MKNILIATLFVFTVFAAGCKDDSSDTDPTPGTTDVRDNILGDYSCNYKVFNAVTGAEQKKGSFELKVYANSTDANMFDFRIDGLIHFMSGTNLVKVSDGYTFTVPEQDVEDFGTIVGKKIQNVTGQTTKVAGYLKTANGNVTVYCERANKVGQDDDLFEFEMIKK